LNIILLYLNRKHKKVIPGKVMKKGEIRSKENEKNFTNLFRFSLLDGDGSKAGIRAYHT
jgi:hypothetical protein